jgi:endoglucanase
MKSYEIPDNEALALIKDMKCGWNLGNTFDSFDGYTAHSEGTGMESGWGAAKTTRKLIDTISDAGFNAIRIPVSWHNHVDGNDRIDADWLARVRQVAGLALDRDMYVIVNVHHDNDKRWFYPDEEHFERSAAFLTAVWTQLAETFSDCGDRLILESMNEPRLVGTPEEWNWSHKNKKCLEAAGCINRLNQLFVDTVRATGGSNATRYLAVPAYCASPWAAVDSAFVLPQDSAENRIIVEAHAYTPYNFALNLDSQDRTFDLDTDQGKKNEIAQFLNKLYNRFVSRGIPVMMDEFGALNKSENTQDRVNFTAWYVAAASARGITCFWWDNHNFTNQGERFCLIDRRTCEWIYPDIVRAIMENCLIGRE